MTNKERVHATLEGKPVDRYPVTSIYNFLYQMDHFSELTGLPAWRRHQWVIDSPDNHAELFGQMQQQAPFEILQPRDAPSVESRKCKKIIEKDTHWYLHDSSTDKTVQLDVSTASGHSSDYHANEKRYIFEKKDVNSHILISKAEELLTEGINDYRDAIISKFGKDEFVLSGGVIGTFYSCHQYFGLTNLFPMLLDEPELIEYASRRILEKNIEKIRCIAKAGGDAIYIDDACTTCDLISIEHYERFSFPYMQEMVNEIHKLGHKAILIYFGGISDRLEQIAQIGADGLLFEASMKGYINDVAEIVSKIGKKVTVFGNVDPCSILQDGTDAELECELKRQFEAAKKGRGFILSTSSPITPLTPLFRVQNFLKSGCDLQFNKRNNLD